MSPPPVNTYQRAADLGSRELPLDLDRNFETTKAYAKAVKEVAHAKQVAFVDIWTEFWQAAGEKEVELSRYLIDGLHPNENGYRVIKCSCLLNGKSYSQAVLSAGHVRRLDEDDRRNIS